MCSISKCNINNITKKSLKQRLNIQTNLKEIGFKETLNDDEFKYETELWFVVI